VTPRLLDTDEAARYLGVCGGTVRSLIAKGKLTAIRPPGMRRLLFDVRDLDVLVEQWKRASSAEPIAQLSQAALTGWENRRKKGAA
jgi:excisionase family DNA binding protein